MKRVPNPQRSSFATVWGRLLDEAVDSRLESVWSEFFAFPKCVLWKPVRGGKRLSKKANMADLVRVRLGEWMAGEKESLWRDAVERSKRAFTAPEPPRNIVSAVGEECHGESGRQPQLPLDTPLRSCDP